MRSRLPGLGLFAVVVVWASTFVLTKQAFDEISPLAFAFVRFVGITGLAFSVLAASARAGTARWAISGAVQRYPTATYTAYTLLAGRDFARVNEDATSARWNALMAELRARAPEATPDEWWAPMELVFDMDWPQHR